MWQAVPIPYVCERVIAFSLPDADGMLVVSYEGMHWVRWREQVSVVHDARFAEYVAYDPGNGVAQWRGRSYPMVGLHGGPAIRASARGETLEWRREAETVAVVRDGVTEFLAHCEDASGDWAAVTFGADGDWFALGLPYRVSVWRRVPDR